MYAHSTPKTAKTDHRPAYMHSHNITNVDVQPVFWFLRKWFVMLLNGYRNSRNITNQVIREA